MRGPTAGGGYPVWSDRHGPIEVRFVGRGPTDRRAAAVAAGAPRELAWSQQVHSGRVLDAVAGPCGEGDALVTHSADLALSVVTADCVPVLIAADGEIASAHAGWRGVVAGVVGETLSRLDTPVERLVAWLGPAIGSCCYEVGEDVASRVAAASDPEVVIRTAGHRPHLDLHRAVESQLRQAGVGTVHRLPVCTRCKAESLHSYRRDGPGAGRNLAFVWRSG